VRHLRSDWFSALDDPRRTESIGEHSKAACPKSLLNRHLHDPVIREHGENAVSLGGRVDF